MFQKQIKYNSVPRVMSSELYFRKISALKYLAESSVKEAAESASRGAVTSLTPPSPFSLDFLSNSGFSSRLSISNSRGG